MTVNLYGQEFKSQKAAQEFVRTKLKSFDPNDPLWLELVDRHPERERKIGYGIEAFFVTKNSANPKALQLNIKRVDGSTIDISWLTCVSEKSKTHRQKLFAAMRLAISAQTQGFKAVYLDKDQMTCESCHILIKEKHEAHVDHFGIKFKQLVQDFINNQVAFSYEELPKTFDDCERTNAAKFAVEDGTFERDWQKYHKAYAKLRLLCARCNLSDQK